MPCPRASGIECGVTSQITDTISSIRYFINHSRSRSAIVRRRNSDQKKIFGLRLLRGNTSSAISQDKGAKSLPCDATCGRRSSKLKTDSSPPGKSLRGEILVSWPYSSSRTRYNGGYDAIASFLCLSLTTFLSTVSRVTPNVICARPGGLSCHEIMKIGGSSTAGPCQSFANCRIPVPDALMR